MVDMKHAAAAASLIAALSLAATNTDGAPTASVSTSAQSELEAELANVTAKLEHRTRQLALRQHVVNQRTRQLNRKRAEVRSLTAQLDTRGSGDVREQFATGYRLAGGTNLAAFTSGTCGGIVDAESDWNADADNTGLNRNGSADHGLAQINDRVWASTFVEVTGQPFDPGVYDPLLNGFMAGVVEDRQGLSAWVSYNNGCGR